VIKKDVIAQVLQLSENSDWKDGRMDGWKGSVPRASCRYSIPSVFAPYCIIMIFIAVHLLLTADSALAHKMMMDSMVNDNGTVLLETFFPDGTPARSTKVEVFSPDGSQFVTGTTNADGQFIFTPGREAGVWKAVATGKMGHKTSTEFEIGAGISAEEQTEALKESKPARKRIAHKEPIPWNQILSGFGFIFGISAFIISLKLKADLKKLKNALTSTRN